jgi:hypothetical protein
MRPLVVGRLACSGIATRGLLVELAPDRTQPRLTLLLSLGPRCRCSGCRGLTSSILPGCILSRGFSACCLLSCRFLSCRLLASSFLASSFKTSRFLPGRFEP